MKPRSLEEFILYLIDTCELRKGKKVKGLVDEDLKIYEITVKRTYL